MERLEGGKGEGRGAGGASVGATGRLAQLNRKKQILTSAANFGTPGSTFYPPRCRCSTSRWCTREQIPVPCRLEGACWLRTAEASPFLDVVPAGHGRE